MDWLGRFTTETPQKLMVKTCKKHDFRSRFSENQSSDTKKLSKIHGKKPWFPLVSGSDVHKKTNPLRHTALDDQKPMTFPA
jgi:hypothetical protein